MFLISECVGSNGCDRYLNRDGGKPEKCAPINHAITPSDKPLVVWHFFTAIWSKKACSWKPTSHSCKKNTIWLTVLTTTSVYFPNGAIFFFHFICPVQTPGERQDTNKKMWRATPLVARGWGSIFPAHKKRAIFHFTGQLCWIDIYFHQSNKIQHNPHLGTNTILSSSALFTITVRMAKSDEKLLSFQYFLSFTAAECVASSAANKQCTFFGWSPCNIRKRVEWVRWKFGQPVKRDRRTGCFPIILQPFLKKHFWEFLKVSCSISLEIPPRSSVRIPPEISLRRSLRGFCQILLRVFF